MHPEVIEMGPCRPPRSSIFDRCWWQYAMCREHFFTDHTQEITSALAPLLNGVHRRHLLEAGCGPGFYSRRLAARFPSFHITGIDLSEPLLDWAREQARRSALHNCQFLRADARLLADYPRQVDAVIASRFFLILSDPLGAMAAMYTTLRPGGLCFIAEPTSPLRAAIPMMLMRAATGITRADASTESHSCRVLSHDGFTQLAKSQPWQSVRIWHDGQYQFALCEKSA